MLFLSIDVGMKNLAYCIIDYNEQIEIKHWGIINLCNDKKYICNGFYINMCLRCNRKQHQHLRIIVCFSFIIFYACSLKLAKFKSIAKVQFNVHLQFTIEQRNYRNVRYCLCKRDLQNW